MKLAGATSLPKQQNAQPSVSTMNNASSVLYCWTTLVLLSDIVPLKIDFALYLKPENSVYRTCHIAIFFLLRQTKLCVLFLVHGFLLLFQAIKVFVFIRDR